jgi:hypothetical protein
MGSFFRRQNPIAPTIRRQYGGVSVYPTDLGPAPLAPTLPGAGYSEGGIRIGSLPGQNFPAAGSTPVDEIGDANIAPGGTATLVTVNVPSSSTLVIVGIGFGADDEVALASLTWKLQVNSAPTPGYWGVPAAIGSIRQLAEVVVVVGSEGTLTIDATAAASAVLTYRFIARVRGWLWQDKGAR